MSYQILGQSASDEAVFYVNGEEIGRNDEDYTGTMQTDEGNNYHVNIGNSKEGGDPFPGKIQDVFIIDRVMSQDEIEAYSSGNAYSIE